MGKRSILCLVTLVVSLSHTQGWNLQTEEEVTAIMIHHTTLTCVFTGLPKEWIFIRWQKTLNETESIDLALLRNSHPEASLGEWSALAPDDFRNHVVLINDVTETNSTFNMRIDGMTCDDQGVYTCQVYTMSGDRSSSTKLVIEAYPDPPAIDTDSVEVSENSTFTIECHGRLGLPPASLSWRIKPSGDKVYSYVIPATSYTQTNSMTNDCVERGLGKLTLTMKPELDGAIVECYAESFLENFRPVPDDTILILHRPTTAPPATLSTAACTGKHCVQIVDDDSAAQTTRLHPVLLLVSLACLFILHMRSQGNI